MPDKSGLVQMSENDVEHLRQNVQDFLSNHKCPTKNEVSDHIASLGWCIADRPMFHEWLQKNFNICSTAVPLEEVLDLIEKEPEFPGSMTQELIDQTQKMFQDNPSAPFRLACSATKKSLVKKLKEKYGE